MVQIDNAQAIQLAYFGYIFIENLMYFKGPVYATVGDIPPLSISQMIIKNTINFMVVDTMQPKKKVKDLNKEYNSI